MTQDRSTNRYNPNSGSQNDIIDQLIQMGASDDEIMDILNQQAGGADMAAGGDELGFLEDQLAAEAEQQDFENLMGILGLMDEGGSQTPEVISDRGRDLVGNNMSIPDAGNEIAASTMYSRNNMGLINDDIMRQRNQKALDRNPPMMSQPAAPGRSLLDRLAEAKTIMEMLKGKAGTGTPSETMTATPPAQIPVAPAQAGPTDGGWGILGDEQATSPGTTNYLIELRKRAMAGR